MTQLRTFVPSTLLRAGVLSALLAGAATPAAAQRDYERPTQPAAPSRDTALTLGEAARLAARQSAPAQAALARVEQAGARVVQSRSALLPEVSVNAYSRQRTFNTAEMGIDFPAAPGQKPLFDPEGSVLGPVNAYDVRARATQTLFNAAAIGRVRAARAAERASGAEATNAGQVAAAQAATTYLRALRADAQLSARIADSSLAGDLLTIARQQLRAGTGVALDVTRAESQLATARAALIAARNERDRARLELVRAVGLSADAGVRPTDSLTRLPMTEEDVEEATHVQRALATRADLRAAIAQLDAVRQQTKAIKAERLPTVGAFVDEGTLGKRTDLLKNTYTWGIQASLPIFEGFRREGRVEEQQAVAREIDVRRRDLETQAAVEVRGALLDLRSAREQTSAARERLRLAEQEVSQARDRFRAGVSGNADVITASLSLNAARTGYVDALASYQNARLALARAEGTVTDLP